MTIAPIPLTAALFDRLTAKLEPSGACLVFAGGRSHRGYGVLMARIEGKRRPILAHRLSWAQAQGRDPAPGMVILHTCGNPACCAPAHLYEAAKPSKGKALLGIKGPDHPAAYPQSVRDTVLAILDRHVREGHGLRFSHPEVTVHVNRDTASRWWKARGRQSGMGYLGHP